METAEPGEEAAERPGVDEWMTELFAESDGDAVLAVEIY
jgi:hypothetical protein